MPPPSPAPESQAAPHPHRWAMLAGVLLVYFCFGTTSAAIAPLVPRITAELHLSHTQMGSILGAWQLIYIGAAIPCGALMDRLGPRRAMAVGALVIAASGMFRGLASDFVTMFLAVAAFGVGGPLVSIGAPKVISQWFVGRERGLAMGLYMVGQSTGTIGALALTPSLFIAWAGGDWRRVLTAYGVLALGAALVWTLISSHPASRALERRIAAEPKLATAGVFLELLRARPMQMVLALAVGTFFFGHSLNNWLPEILHAAGMKMSRAGFWSAVPVAVGILAALNFPRLAIPSRCMAILAGLFTCQMLAPLLIEWGGSAPLATGLILQGLARGSLSTIVLLVLMELKEVDSRRMGAAGGMYFAAGEIGGVLGPLTIGTLADITGGFAAGLYFLTGVCAMQLFLLSRLRRSLG